MYHSCLFIAAVCQSAIPFKRQKVSAAECHIRNGAPRFLIFRGLQTKRRDTHRASSKQPVNQQCTNTNANIVVSFAATTSKRQPLEHILLPEHSSHIKFRAMGFSYFAWLGRAHDRSKQPAKMNIHRFHINFVFFFVASGGICNRSRNSVKEMQAFHQGYGPVAKNVSVCKEFLRCSL